MIFLLDLVISGVGLSRKSSAGGRHLLCRMQIQNEPDRDHETSTEKSRSGGVSVIM